VSGRSRSTGKRQQVGGRSRSADERQQLGSGRRGERGLGADLELLADDRGVLVLLDPLHDSGNAGLDDGVALGPLVNKEGRDKVIELVDDAVKKGAKILTGGKSSDGPGYFYPATVLDNVSNDAKMLNEEIFGPVASIQTFKSEDEVITRANDTEYGLVAYLYTKDLSRGMRVSEQLDFGMIGLNRGLVSDPAAPFGGTKQSGLGREGAHEGMLEFLETQYISVTW